MLAKHDKTHGHDKNSILLIIYVLLFQSTLDEIVSNQPNAKHDNGTQDLDSTDTNNLPHPVTQCTHVSATKRI